MIKLFSFETARNTVRNPRFWIIVCIMFALFFLYRSWPWKNFSYWLWRLAAIEFKMNFIGSLFFIPIVLATLFFKWRGGLVVWLLSMIAIMPLVIIGSIDAVALLRNLAFLLFPLLVVLLIAVELNWRKVEIRNIREREADRQLFVLQLINVQEKERMRIAQELHDDTLQALLVIANHVQSLVPSNHDEAKSEVGRNIECIRDEILDVSKDVRRLSLCLGPHILDSLGLIPALRWLADTLRNEDNIDAELLVSGSECKLSSEVEINVFRMVQESLSNVKRHSAASKALIRVKFCPGSLKITIEDNGVGFPFEEIKGTLAMRGNLGLLGLQQRAQFLNGEISIHSATGKGTSIEIEVPC